MTQDLKNDLSHVIGLLRNHQAEGVEPNLIRDFAADWLITELASGKPRGVTVLDHLRHTIETGKSDLGYQEEITLKLAAWYDALQAFVSAWEAFSGEPYALESLEDFLEAAVSWHAFELVQELATGILGKRVE